MKAEDSVTIDLAGKSSIADFMVVASGRSNRHVAAVAENVIKELERKPMWPRVRVEGLRQGDWVLIDAGRRHRSPVPAGSAPPHYLWKNVVGRPRRDKTPTTGDMGEEGRSNGKFPRLFY